MIASAPAKIILLGEHAVVYGQPALAVPVSQLRAYARVEPNADGLRIVATDIGETLPVNVDDATVTNALQQMARLTLHHLQAPPPAVTITVWSEIPLASGLGSGAAVSAALGRALAAAVNRTLDDADLNRLVYEVERTHHGTPSGIDNTVIVYEKPVYFVRDHTLETFSIPQPFTLHIADTGRAALTRVAVGDVRSLYEADPAGIQPVLDEIGVLVREARAALENGKIADLGRLMDENHRLLQRLTVSSPELDTLVTAARAAGALGAKLSGGGRGGNMIALVTDDTTDAVSAALTAALTAAGAARIMTTTVQG